MNCGYYFKPVIISLECRMLSSSVSVYCTAHLCQSQPCKNGGECTDNFHSHLGYVCRCLPGYVGYLCEHGQSRDPKSGHSLSKCRWTQLKTRVNWCSNSNKMTETSYHGWIQKTLGVTSNLAKMADRAWRRLVVVSASVLPNLLTRCVQVGWPFDYYFNLHFLNETSIINQSHHTLQTCKWRHHASSSQPTHHSSPDSQANWPARAHHHCISTGHNLDPHLCRLLLSLRTQVCIVGYLDA